MNELKNYSRTFAFSTTEHFNQKNCLRYFKYFIVGCGLPILMTLAIFLIDFYKLGSVLPEVGTVQCFLSPRGAKYYFHLPISILLCFNSIAFFVTVFALWRRYKSNKAVTSSRRALLSVQVGNKISLIFNKDYYINKSQRSTF